jgi:uncharacterized phage protein (TIGR01671 family)
MKEIKFKAWDKEFKQIVDITGINWMNGTCQLTRQASDEYWHKIEDFILMEYTGLKDKNGVEIYKGYIVTTNTGKNMVIGWSDRFASFVIEREDWVFQHYFGESMESEDCEIVGDIYQNPELLK